MTSLYRLMRAFSCPNRYLCGGGLDTIAKCEPRTATIRNQPKDNRRNGIGDMARGREKDQSVSS